MNTISSHPLRFLSMLILAGTLLTASAMAQSSTPSPGANATATDETVVYATLGNPAAVHCKDMGYKYEIVGDNGQRGICALPSGQVCDAWEFLQGKCGQSYSHCAQQGYQIRTVGDGKDPFSPEYAVCVTSEGVVIGSVTELSNLSEKATGCGGDTVDGEMPPMVEEGDEYVPPLDGDPPTSFDWRSYQGSDWLTPVKDQGGCGSCWAFSAVGVTEAAHNIASNDPSLDKDLSEQYLVAGCSNSGSCCGGWKSSALAYIRDSGIPDESCLSYVDGDGCSCGSTCDINCTYNTGSSCSDRTCSDRCGDWSSRLEYITSMGSVSTDLQTIKQALVDIGPLAVSMGYGSSYGGYWDGDIYRCTLDSGTNHAVIIVGYDDAGGYWWVRNSWGTAWGDNGYFKLGYGECYIEQYVYYADAGPSDVGPLEYHSHTIDDDSIDNSNGNGDGVADCGETIELYVDLLNQGTHTATGVSATISTSDPYVTWLFNTSSSYLDIAGGETGTNSNDYDLAVDPSTPNGHVVHFDLDITASNGGPWTDSFDVPVTCVSNNPPNTPGSPSPADGVTGVSTTTDLSWSGGDPDTGDTVTYDVYFAASNPPTALLCHDVSSTTCDPGTMAYDTQYYWYVVATDNHAASTSGPIWDFTTGPQPNNPPNTPGSPSPADGATGVSATTDLSWAGGDPDSGDTVTYDVYFGTSDPPTTLLCKDLSSTTCDPGTLSYDTHYYWYVIATDNHAASTGGPVWDFTTEPEPNNPPNTPGSPSPADGATGVSATTGLSWAGGDPDLGDTVTYDVYFGTSDPPTTRLCNGVSSTNCDPGSLSYGTHYYWYVVATDSHAASTTGAVWDFSTTAGPDAYEPDNTWDQANWIHDGSPQTHSIAPVGDVDWVKFSLSEESEVVIETSGPSGDTRMWLFDSGLNQLEYDDDGGSGLFSRIDRLCGTDALPAGTYYVWIAEYESNDEIPSYDIALTVLQACEDAHWIYVPIVKKNYR